MPSLGLSLSLSLSPSYLDNSKMKLHHPLNPLLSQAELRISHHVFKLDDLLGCSKKDPWGTMSNAIENISEALLSAIGFRKDGGTLSDVFKVDVVPRSRCYIDHIGWGHFSKAELETSVRTLGRDVVDRAKAAIH
ncbi:unnamed protein product [Camellia sinensis]